MRHLISINDLTRDEILAILDEAERRKQGHAEPVSHFVALLAFFEPSVRTRIGFAAAVARLGGTPIDFFGPKHTPDMSESESLTDAIRCATGQADVLILRHGDAAQHAAAVAASMCPVINAANGREEHPTQALVDLFAIRSSLGRLESLRVGIVGDPDSRSAHSLLGALGKFDPSSIRLIHPASRPWSLDRVRDLSASRVVHTERMDLEELDVLYMSGLPEVSQHGRLGAEERSAFALTSQRLAALPENSAVLCPLPRVDEIDPAVDGDRRCRYFNQSDGGQYVRQALLGAALQWGR